MNILVIHLISLQGTILFDENHYDVLCTHICENITTRWNLSHNTNMPVSIIRTLIDVCITITYSTKYDKHYTFILSACHIEFHYNSFTPAKDEESDRKSLQNVLFQKNFLLYRLICICLYLSIHLLNKFASIWHSLYRMPWSIWYNCTNRHRFYQSKTINVQ